MTPCTYKVVDNFLDDFEAFDTWAREQEYTGQESPHDGVVYPDLVIDLPASVMQEVAEKIGATTFLPFLRLSTTNTAVAPHQAHNDITHGDYTFLLYMQDGPGGTSLVKHKELDMHDGLTTELEEKVWNRDTNNPDKWDVTHLFKMKANRAVWYPSNYMHRAEPIGGFGEGTQDGRLVLTLFFNKGEEDGKGNTWDC